MQLAGADANLRAEAKLLAVGETGGGIPVNRRRIDFAEEPLGQFRVAGDDAIAVVRAAAFDVLEASLGESTTFSARTKSRYSVDQSSSVAEVSRW